MFGSSDGEGVWLPKVLSNDTDGQAVVDTNEAHVSLPGNVAVFIPEVDKSYLLLVLHEHEPEAVQFLMGGEEEEALDSTTVSRI